MLIASAQLTTVVSLEVTIGLSTAVSVPLTLATSVKVFTRGLTVVVITTVNTGFCQDACGFDSSRR